MGSKLSKEEKKASEETIATTVTSTTVTATADKNEKDKLKTKVKVEKDKRKEKEKEERERNKLSAKPSIALQPVRIWDYVLCNIRAIFPIFNEQ